ncbi:MAG: VOC family protein [Candidatus Eremiobacteraeota bacterium]|nr:VOC family protein [Candidatus Eremiobacteraeota bacterium]
MKNRGRVIGIGGVFFRSSDPDALQRWYVEHLSLPEDPNSGVVFECGKNSEHGITVWSPFERDTEYFGRPDQQCMFNYRVENLDTLLERLRAEGVEIDPKREDYDYGRFAWIVDPEGNRVELWEPKNPQ